MTYETYEESSYSGSPIELYRFDRNSVSYWTYTSADTSQTYGGRTYTPIAISRNAIEQSQDTGRSGLLVTMPSDVGFLDQFVGTSPPDVINLTLYRLHYGDGNVVTTWVGRVINIGYSGYEVEVHCESIQTALLRLIGRRQYQVSCPHKLFGTACGVTKSAFKTGDGVDQPTISSIDGVTLEITNIDSYDEDYFSGGTIEFAYSGLTTRRLITSHSASTVVINLPLTGAEEGSSVDLYPGCKHNLSDCKNVFDNILNYGGQPFIPDVNPFETVVV